jgi:Flp pilus assembly protein TadD
MLLDNLKLLFRLYVRPRSTMSMIVDEGSLIFAAAVVAILTFLLSAASGVVGVLESAAVTTEVAEGDMPEATGATAALFTVASMFGPFMLTIGLAVLYVPGLIFVMTLLDRRTGSFGVALSRDYGSLAPCVLLSCAASELLFGTMWLLLAPLMPCTGIGMIATLILWALGTLYFALLVLIAVRTVYGARMGPSVVAAALPFLLMPFASYLSILASPFMLYWVYLYTRSDISAIQWALGSRRAFKRHLEAATINPRDAEAHYQLGLIHQHRRQYAEATSRFKKAVEIDAGEIDAHYQLGRIAREQGRHAEAIQHFEPVVARDPKHSRYEIWREVGATYVDASDFANARPMLERYVENRPYDPEGLYLLGLTLKKLNEPEKARVVFERCVEATKTAPDYRRGELRHWRNRAQAEL